MLQEAMRYQFGDWLIEPGLNCVRKGTIEHELEPKAMAVLSYLLQHAGELVTTAQLMSNVWPETMVEENAIQQRVSRIRRVLGDDARNPRFIKTISRKGYQTIAMVQPAATPGVEDLQVPQSTHTPLRLAVLPFSNLTSGEDSVYFSSGISDDIRTLLAKVPVLSVIARTSSGRFGSSDFVLDEVAKKLGVSLVVHGSVRSVGAQLRLTVELIHAQSRHVVWTDQFDGNIDELHSIENRIARDILQELAPDSAVVDPYSKIDSKAYAAYLLGRHVEFNDTAAARKQFELALSIAPEYAAAHAAVAWSYIDDVNYGLAAAPLAFPKAQISISKALAADPTQMEALIATNVLIVVLGHEFQEALNSLNELIVRDPTNDRILLIYIVLLIMIGRHEQALKIAEHWTQVDPLSENARRSRASLLLNVPHPELSEVLEEIRILESITATTALHQRFRLAVYQENRPLAIEFARLLAQQEKGVSSLWAEFRAVLLEQDHQSARAIAQQLVEEKIVPAQMRAYAWLLLGDKKKVFSSVAQGLEQGQIQVIMALRDNAGPRALDALPWLYNLPELEPLRRLSNVDDESLSQLVVPPLPF